MAGVVDDEMLDVFVPTAPYVDIADVLRERYADLSTWITFPMPEDPACDPECRKAIESLQG